MVTAVQRRPLEAVGRMVHSVPADLGPGWTRVLQRDADVVVWVAQSRRYREFPDGAEDMFRVNEAALYDLLEWSREHGVRRLVYASSGSVYAPSTEPLSESSPIAPRTFYAATKLNGEQLVRQYAGVFEVVILRLFALYGPGQRSLAVANVMEAVLNGDVVGLSGGVGMTFTPLYVADAASVVESLLRRPLPANCLVTNVAGSEVVTLADVAQETARQTGKSVVLQPTGGVAATLIADTGLLRSLLPAFRARPLSAGIAEVVAARAADSHYDGME
jgi:nucleoside-diphosphate-sugar epimerase